MSRYGILCAALVFVFLAGPAALPASGVAAMAVPNRSSEPMETVVVTDGTWQVSNLGVLATEVPCVRFNWLAPAQVAPAQWIWTGADVCGAAQDNEAHTFTKSFTITGTVQSALLEFAVDNYIAVSINGSPAPTACDAAVDIWGCFQDRNTADVAALLHSGQNQIALTASNINSAAGVIARLSVRSMDLFPVAYLPLLRKPAD